MSKHEEDIIELRDCACGCSEKLKIRKRHLYPSHIKDFPRFIKGHQQYGNKRGWKGGEIKEQHGYVVVYSPEHPFKNAMGGGYVKRSRLVMEKVIGRYLRKDEVIHHINGIRDDDKPENLVITTQSKHLSHHHKNIFKLRDVNGRFTKGA